MMTGNNKNGTKRTLWQRVVSFMMALAMVFSFVPTAAFAAELKGGETLYLKPNSNWTQGNARFAAYFFGDGNTWVSMSDTDSDGIYEVTAPSGNWTNVIFCRMNPSAAANNWDNKWNQTADLTYDGTKNLYTVADGTWDSGGGTWSVYPEPTPEPTATPTATPTPTPTPTPEPEEAVLYLKPNSNWTQSGARFAAYFFGNGESWVSMTDADGDGVYEVTAPEGYPNVIFCRMNPSTTANNWDNKWNQTADLTVPTDGTNCYTVADGTWDKGGGTWSVYPEPTPEPTATPTATPTPTPTPTPEPEEAVLYLKPNSNWTQGDARFAAYFFGNGESWVSMTDADGDGVYEVTAPEGYPNVIFCRMNPSTTANSWDNKWNQTADLTVPTDGTNCYTVADGTWDKGGGTWSVYPEPTPEPTATPTATPVPATDYYLVGYINNADYNGNDYKFVDGKVTVTFANDSYVVVKDASGDWYLCESYCTDTTTTLIKGKSEKMFVAAGTEWEFTLVENGDGTLTLSYAEVTGDDEPATDYYLVGYINNADYNGNDYKFVDGKVTVTFANDSYVVVKDASGDWYLCESYCTDTTATLIKGKSEKMFVAAGTEWEFTLVENGDGTLTLSYAEVTGDDSDDGDDTAKTTYTVTFHVANTMGWSPLNLYVWNNDGASTGGWPGTDMNTKDVDGYNTLSVSYDSASNQGLNYIFNNGSTQTVDLKVDAAVFGDKTAIDLWFKLDPTRTNSEGKVLAEGVTVSTEPFDDVLLAVSPQISDADGDGKVNDVVFEYAGDNATTSVELRGTVTGASWDTGPALTDTDGDKLWTLTVKDLAPAVYEYKFVVNGESWTTDPANGKINAEGNSVFTIRNTEAQDDNTITVNVYYDRDDGIYTVENADGVGVTGVWNAYAWGDSIPGTRMDFAEDENGKMVSTIELKGRETTYIAFKTRLSTAAKDWLQEESEVRVNLTKVLAGTVNVYITSNGTGGNKGTLTSSIVEDTDVFEGNKVLSASYNYDNNTIEVTMLEALADANELTLKAPAGGVDVASIAASGVTYTLSLSAQPALSALSQYKIVYDGYEYDIDADAMYASDKFADEFTYDGDDLGANYTAAGTTFKVWAPTATAVDVLLYADGNAVDKFGNFEGTASAPFADYRMTKGENGVWSVTIDGELKGVYYTYQVWFGDEKVEAVDPYARATGVNGMRGMVIDLDATDPEGWDTDTNPNPVTSQTDAIIYELHVRDFSIDDSSGVSEANRGKYLAFTEEGTTTESGSVTGIDYLDELGITHLHLLPVYDYASVDETKCDSFNWGYDPQNYNVPEGSYSTDPYNGAVRVKEFKQMVKSLHDHDISVIMDVVYNHVYDADTFCYNNIVPGYFSRVNSNTSGCGNDTASEREMVRKYIVESVLYWAEEYHIDGFRFDLVGLLDVQTINQIVTEVHAIRPDIVFYGEGWDMDSTNKEPGTEMAKQGNASKTPGFAYFSDSMRNGIAGSNGQSTGFASGAGNGGAMESEWKANPWWTTNPQQVIQYASCHDNYTLIDKLVLSTGASGLNSSIIKMNNLTAAFYMTSQGVTFIHAGEEFLREKLEEDGGRCENSYNASDFVNHIEWSNLDSTAFDYAGNVEYYKGLIEFRKAHPALRYATAAEVAANVTTLANDGKLMVMRVDGNGYNTANPDAAVAENDILVIFNSNSASQSVTLPDGEWTVNINATKAGTASLGTAEGTVTVDGISAMVLTTVDMGKDEEPPAAASKEKTIYFSNNKHWDKVYAYYWTDDDSVDDPEWPGIQLMQPVGTNDYGEDIYAVTLPAADPGIAGLIFSDGGSEQTVDIVPGIDGTGYYPTDSKNDEGKWPVGSWQYRAPQLGAADEYFLVGYINNVDYAGDEYKFDENGQLTTTFPTDSYVYVVNGTGALTYMTDGYLGTVTEAMLENIATETLNSDKWDKMLIPGGAEVTITLEKNDGDDRCVWLSYEIAYTDLTDASGVQDGVTLHAWNWSFAEIEANMAQIAAQGYTAVQTSPVQAMKEPTVGSTVGTHWWVYYQPVDFVINDDEGNALGTKAELESMIETAHEYGVKVIVDVVANHLGNKTGNDLADAIPDYLRKDEYWHSIDINISNWNDRYNMTQYCLDGLPDLNTANDELQGYVLDFLKECVDAGVDGFRFDMAKSIETPKDDDSFASDFWPTVVGGAEAYALANYDKDLYIYGEVLDNAGISINAYTEYMAVTDNGWGNHMRSNVADGKAELVAGFYKAAPADQLVIWAESHDTYATSDAGQSSAGVSEADINKTWALVAAREGAMGLYLARPANNDQLLGVGAVTGWANPEVAEVNKFHTLFAGTSETIGNEVMDNGVAVSYVVRSNHGAVLVKVAGSGASRSGETAVSFAAPAMADGTYADQITGNTFTVTNGVISGSIGTTGIAVLYDPADTIFDITAEDTTGGSFVVQDATAGTAITEAQVDDLVRIVATPETGKVVERVTVTTVNGLVDVIDEGDNAYSFIMPWDDVTVAVTFADTEYAITLLPDDGTVNCNQTENSAPYGAEVCVWANPGEGMMVETVTVADANGNAVETTYLYELDGEYNYSFVMPASDVIVTFTYAEDVAPNYPITVAPATGGSVYVNYALDGGAEEGDIVQIEAIPDEGMAVDAITVTDADGNPVEVEFMYEVDGVCTYQFPMPASAVTIAVTFKEAAAEAELYDITVNAGEGGTVLLPADGLPAGTLVTFEVLPEDGMEIDTVTVTGVDGRDVPVTKVEATTFARARAAAGVLYSYVQPDCDVIIEVTFKAAEAPTPTPTPVPGGSEPAPTPTPVPGGSEPAPAPTPAPGGSAPTGDSAPVVLWLGAMAAAGMAAFGLLCFKRKKSEEEA